jgi:hypothetical protein
MQNRSRSRCAVAPNTLFALIRSTELIDLSYFANVPQV